MQAQLLRWRGQVFDQAPGRLFVLRLAEHNETGAARDRCARSFRARQRHGHPRILQVFGHALAKFSDVPWPADVKREEAAAKLVPHVGNARVVHTRREVGVKQALIEGQGAAEAGTAEIAVAAVVAQQRIRLLHREVKQRLELVERQQHGVAVRAGLPLDGHHRSPPRRPVRWRAGDAGSLQQVAAVIRDSRFHIPRHCVGRALDHACVPCTGEVIFAGETWRSRDAVVQGFQRIQRGELGDPGIAQRHHVRQRIAGERGEQLFVRRSPRKLLQVDTDAGVAALELGQQLRHHLAFMAHGPEPHHLALVLRRAAAARDQQRA